MLFSRISFAVNTDIRLIINEIMNCDFLTCTLSLKIMHRNLFIFIRPI